MRLADKVLLSFLLVFLLNQTFGQTVTPSGSKNLCVGGTAIVLDDIIVTEDLTNDFGVSGSFTYMLNAPANFQFVNSTGAAFISAGSQISALSFTRGTSSFSINYTHSVGGPAPFDEFTITGLQIEAITTPSGPSSIIATGTSIAADGVTSHGMVTSNLPTSSVLAGNATICVGSSTNLTVTITGGTGPYTIQIDNGVGIIGGYISGSNISVSPSATTTYNLISVTDAGGCVGIGLSGTPTVTVDQIPTSDAGLDDEICSDQATYTVSGSGSANGTILWTSSSGGSFVDNSIENPVYNINATDVTNGTVTLTKTVTAALGACTAAVDAMVLTVTPTPNMAAAGSDLGQCNNSTFVMSANVPVVGTGTWSVQSGFAVTITNPTSATTTITGLTAG
ncbi:MAG: hypothetical protein AAGA02_02110, partial [Bacteroidota bacterium]